MQDLIKLERQGWQALSSEGDAGKRFYNSILHDDAMMLFAGGMRIDGKQKILESLAAQPWKSFEVEEPKSLTLSENVKILVYKVTAQREGSEPYVALISSTYTFSEGKWKLVLHQQTPV